MIVDIHTHIFPPEFVARRTRIARSEPAFAEMYADARAAMATAEDLLASMQQAGVDVSVACGFWWDDPALARDHAAYLVEVAAASDGRLLAFVPTPAPPPGAHGVGEVRETAPARFPETALPVLAHCSEGLGHDYPGKAGGLDAAALWAVLEAQPEARVVAAHLGAGFPFFALMPEVRATIEADRVIFDTAAAAYLYRRDDPAEVYRTLIALLGPRHLAWGSDFPLRPQALDRAEVAAALPAEAREAVLGGNAARFLRLHGHHEASPGGGA
ncbi:MAG: amidohydrolase [Dehalococcoidia bacterium]|nr:amidohydrolase [Dehalococcoidia bacterium]